MDAFFFSNSFFTRRWLLCALTAACLATSAAGQGGQPKTAPQFKNPPVSGSSGDGGGQTSYIVSPDEDYLIGPSDMLTIRVADDDTFNGDYRLNSKGNFWLPLVGTIEARGKRSDELVAIITEKIKEKKFLNNPIVYVAVKQSNSRAFFIQGAVRKPGIYQIEGRPSLLKLITIAGGLADNFGSTAFLMRENKKPDTAGSPAQSQTAAAATTTAAATPDKEKPVVPIVDNVNPDLAGMDESEAGGTTADEPADPNSLDGPELGLQTNTDEYSVTKININNLLRGNLGQNVIIEPGDIVHIPAADGFFVAGEVKTPGYFMLKEGTTLRQAIALAQGVNYQAAGNKAVIFREDAVGKRTEVPIDITAVMTGKSPDINIMPNDIVMVPTSKQKTITKNVLKTLSSSLPGLLLRGLGLY